ncbi:four helix bundle protein [Zunongwangia sp. F363]|uniref:Four helix bundle protein n=1 Tax=Autumnicola tepida TaxID=3075595 RepID=A0ABU3C8P5_9FLAO|nr:four helix bundle protein [Zunongwangia sp. F363]MDT0642713.1 four helix bundle protein [Zunongwangia sp. F363]
MANWINITWYKKREMEKFNFEELKVYQKTLVFIDEIYADTKAFPKEEVYGLTSQFRRAAISIALNITEGAGSSNPEFRRYLQIALNSVKE